MTYRNKNHTDLCHDVPCICSFPHECKGPSVPMHCNELSTDRGAYFKAPDWAVAAGCSEAHDYIDGRRGKWPKDLKHAEWWRAFVKTQNWLWENEKLIVNKEWRP